MTEIYVLDLIGTFAFAAYGAHVAIRKGFDIFGIFVAAFLTALGGGTLRELILGNVPFYFHDNNYVFVILVGYITIFNQDFLQSIISAGKAVLGICFGDQLIADALGPVVVKTLKKRLAGFL